MKKLSYIFLSLLVLAGCTGTSRQPQLVAMDSLLLSRPDSALTLLRGMTFTDKADRMYHYLLLADACNKCYDTLPSDTILQEVADYYDRHGTPNEQVRAHYLLGCVYRDMGEAPHALDCYQTAVSRADTTSSNCNYRQLMSVYGQMAELFYKQNLPQDYLEAINMSGHLDLLNHDTIGYLRSLELQAKAYDLMRDTLKMQETIRNIRHLYKKHGYIELSTSGNGTLAYIAIIRGELSEAKELMDEYESNSGLFDSEGNIIKGREGYYYTKGMYYQSQGKLDSAEYYMRKMLNTGNDVDAYRGLLSVYRERNDKDSLVKYVQLYEKAIDAYSNYLQTETVSQMSSMYNYQRFQLIAEREEKASSQLKWMLTLVVIISAFVLITITELYRRNRKKKRIELEQLHAKYIQAQTEYRRQEDELVLLIDDAEQLRTRKEEEIAQLKERLDGYKEKLLVITSTNEQSEEQLIHVLRMFRIKASGKKGVLLPTKREWKELITLFKRNKPIEQVTVCKEGLLSPLELRTCILLLLGFSNGEISVLLDASSQRVTNLKSRINKKLFNDDSAGTLQANLKYLSANM